tara:strand:- start:399 stop:743 length:345 start_codon:yes stop_codon:yes gene_type:complete
MITINFAGNINNESLQIGDLAYYVTPSEIGGFNQSTESPILIGPIEAITLNTIDVDNSATGEEPSANDFIMFAKDSRINLSGLVGYYAEAKFKNNSTERAEMYSVGSEITPSSK